MVYFDLLPTISFRNHCIQNTEYRIPLGYLWLRSMSIAREIRVSRVAMGAVRDSWTRIEPSSSPRERLRFMSFPSMRALMPSGMLHPPPRAGLYSAFEGDLVPGVLVVYGLHEGGGIVVAPYLYAYGPLSGDGHHDIGGDDLGDHVMKPEAPDTRGGQDDTV